MKELREKLASLANEIYRLRDILTKENRDFTAEEKAKWDQVNKDYDQGRERLTLLERAEKVQKDLSAPVGDPAIGKDDYNGKDAEKERRKQEKRTAREKEERDYLAANGGKPTAEDEALILQAWMRTQARKPLKRQHEWALKKCGVNARKLNRDFMDFQLGGNYRNVRQRYLPYAAAQRGSMAELEQRALALNLNTAGGYLVPEGFVQNLEVALLLYSNIRVVADVMRTASGQDLPWPSVNDTFNKGSILVENATVGNQDIVFGQTVLHAYKYTSKLVQVPVELLEDSAFDLAAVLGSLLGIRVARIQNDHMTTGTGVAQPTGIVTAATQGVQAGSSTALAWDDLYKLKHAVDPAYRVSALGAGWMFHDQILGFLKRLKDGAGRYLWQSGVSATAPDTIDGDPYTINQSMASTMSTGNRTVLYGAMKKYKVRDVTQMRLRRLVERYADLDQEGYVLFTRFDSTLLDAGTHPIQYIVH